MAKEKTKEASWDQIGKMIGKKIGKEFKKGECGPWNKLKKNEERKRNFAKSCSGGGIYFFGFIGALWYYIATATSFWNGAWGVVKALFWPGFLIFELLKYIGA